jgi:leader peptidase (prepilin peptidase)/N-methyltransferase
MAELLSSSPLALLTFTLLLGLMVGSFLNVVIYRLPVMMEKEWTAQCKALLNPDTEATDTPPERFNLATPRSRCPGCLHEISALENIPVASYLVQGGKCRHCKKPVSPRYPVIEVVTGVLSLLVSSQFGFSWLTLGLLILVWSLIALTMIDFDHQLLPDDITLPLMWLGLAINAAGFGLTSLADSVWGAIAGYGILWCVYWAFKLLTGKEGMGYGDFKLLAALGAWMGWQALPSIILLSSLVGAVVGISLILILGRDRNIPIPFGPYLAAAGFIALLWGDSLNQLYFSYLN